MHACMHAYIHTYIYIHTCMRAYTCTCIQKLVAYSLLKGNTVDADKQLIDWIIDTVCGCFVVVHTDEGSIGM